MRIGEIEADIDYRHGKANKWGFWTIGALTAEGKKILKKYPDYKTLKDDWRVKNDDEFFASVVYAYMVDCILQEYSDNEYLMNEYVKATEDKLATRPSGKGEMSRKGINEAFLKSFEDYIKEQNNPGILKREQEQEEKERAVARALSAEYEAKHPHITCPYCKSTNTEKISTVSRAVSVSLVGAASGKIGKQWHCKNCGSNF